MRFQQDRQQEPNVGVAPWQDVPGKGIHCVVGGRVHEVSQQLVAMLVQDSLLMAATSLSAPLIDTPAHILHSCMPLDPEAMM